MGNKKNELLEEFKPSLQLSGFSIGSSLIGGSLNSKLPVGTPNPLTTTGSTSARFIAPTTAIGASSFTLKQLKKIKMKGGKY